MLTRLKFFAAAESGDLETVRRLLDTRAINDINTNIHFGCKAPKCPKTALYFAIEENQLGIVRELLIRGAQIRGGYFVQAICKGYLEVINELFVHIGDNDIIESVKNNNMELTNLLLEKESDHDFTINMKSDKIVFDTLKQHVEERENNKIRAEHMKLAFLGGEENGTFQSPLTFFGNTMPNVLVDMMDEYLNKKPKKKFGKTI